MESGPNWYKIGNKICYIPKFSGLKKGSISIGLKVLTLANNCVFRRPEIELSFESLEMQKSQRLDKTRWGNFSSCHVYSKSYDN